MPGEFSPAISQAPDPLEDLYRHDIRGLAELTAEQREVQLAARRALHRYVDQLWQEAKARGTNPALHPEWQSWAGLRDFTAALVAHAEHHNTD